jgi:hypothetical protein
MVFENNLILNYNITHHLFLDESTEFVGSDVIGIEPNNVMNYLIDLRISQIVF